MITPLQKLAALAIVNIFETGSVLGDYGSVTVIKGDSGHLTFGRSQTTLSTGNLHKLIANYCENPGARLNRKLTPFLPRLKDRDVSLDHDSYFHNVLRASADDSLMRETQDQFFDETYWEVALKAASELNITTALGIAVVYDSVVHGSWKLIRDKVTAQEGSAKALGERLWIKAYVETREDWLASHGNKVLHATVYRTQALSRLMALGHWGLDLPLVVRGLEISNATLNGLPPRCYDGPQPGSRTLALQSPLAKGLDVRLMQLGLSAKGIDIKADGVFGQTSVLRLQEYQKAEHIPASGVGDVALIMQLVS